MRMADIDDLRTAEFGFPGALRDRLVRAILDGTKTATASLAVEYAGLEPLPRVGERAAVVDSGGRRVAVIETTDVRIVAFGDVDLQFALDEGEGFESVDDWRRAHVRFWEGDEMRAELERADFHVRDDTQIVLERFRLVSP
jgi:uncharacterized protein YhfF